MIDPQGFAREEAHHRFLNTLTSLQGLLRQAFAHLRDPQVQDAIRTFEGHLLAFANVHRSLQLNCASGQINVPDHFTRLCAQIAAVRLAPRGLHCRFSCDEGDMTPEVSEKLGLVIVELVTNAAKHAFLGRNWGEVSIALTHVSERWTCLVQDNGVGLRDGPRGAGLRLVQGLARDLEAEFDIHSDDRGVCITLRLPPRAAFNMQ
jgi:two-component sensor histidine kinase